MDPHSDLFAVSTTTVRTMSSREIADLTGKRHDNVMRDITAMLTQLGEGGLLRFEDTHRNEQNGQSYPIFRLPKRETTILVSGYDVTMRARIIDRWMELEAADAARPQADPIAILNDPAAMRGLLLSYSEKVLSLEADRAVMLPKVEAHDRIAEAYGSLCITDAAKTLQVPPKALFRWMRENLWIYRRAGMDHDVAYQTHIASGRLIHKVEVFQKGDGTDGSRTQVRVTPKGMTVLAKAFPLAAQAA